jgi:hypothetical protein
MIVKHLDETGNRSGFEYESKHETLTFRSAYSRILTDRPTLELNQTAQCCGEPWLIVYSSIDPFGSHPELHDLLILQNSPTDISLYRMYINVQISVGSVFTRGASWSFRTPGHRWVLHVRPGNLRPRDGDWSRPNIEPLNRNNTDVKTGRCSCFHLLFCYSTFCKK